MLHTGLAPDQPETPTQGPVKGTHGDEKKMSRSSHSTSRSRAASQESPAIVHRHGSAATVASETRAAARELVPFRRSHAVDVWPSSNDGGTTKVRRTMSTQRLFNSTKVTSHR